MSATSAGPRLVGPEPSGNRGVPQHGEPPSPNSSSSSPPLLSPHLISSSVQTNTSVDVATEKQLNMQQRSNADTNIIAASIRKGKAAHLKKQFQTTQHKAVDSSPSNSSSNN